MYYMILFNIMTGGFGIEVLEVFRLHNIIAFLLVSKQQLHAHLLATKIVTVIFELEYC